MKTKGIDPKAHGLTKELERVKDVVTRAKQIADRALAPKVDKSAAKRFIRSGLWEPKESESTETLKESSQVVNEDATKPPPSKRQKSGPTSR